MRFGGTHHGYGPRVVFNHDLGSFTHTVEERREVVRGFLIRDMDDVLGHNSIIRRFSPVSTRAFLWRRHIPEGSPWSLARIDRSFRPTPLALANPRLSQLWVCRGF